MNDATIFSIAMRNLNMDVQLQRAFETLKNASEHMTIWIQDANDKEKYYEIKPDSILGWYKLDSIINE